MKCLTHVYQCSVMIDKICQETAKGHDKPESAFLQLDEVEHDLQ